MDVTDLCKGMTAMKRFAIYYAPSQGGFADAAAAWLGWDAVQGCAVAQPRIAGLDMPSLTAEPRRYGFHGTLKPPFRLAEGQDRAGLETALADFAKGRAPVAAGPLRLTRIGPFLAFVPGEPLAALAALAADTVTAFEPFRAALTDAEVARRRPEQLTARQRALLDRYGYPYVMEEFRFHLTVTGPLAEGEAARAEAAAQDWFAPHLGVPMRTRDLCLFGEEEAGRLHLLSRHALTG
jgi:putative phosphonate metabolism protein